MFNFIFKKDDKTNRSNQWIFGTMLAFGIIGLLASFVLAVDEFQLLKNPNTILSCSINIVLNCTNVMKTWQASVFGFPNMFIGLMAFPVVVLVAVLGLNKVVLPRWLYVGANIGYLLGACFAYWLFFNSVYIIQVLCPWCLLVTLTTTLLFATMTHYNLRENTFSFSKSINKKVQSFISAGYHKLAVASWIVLMIVLIFVKFGESLYS
jgi:uncharacterized membrane protein